VFPDDYQRGNVATILIHRAQMLTHFVNASAFQPPGFGQADRIEQSTDYAGA